MRRAFALLFISMVTIPSMAQDKPVAAAQTKPQVISDGRSSQRKAVPTNSPSQSTSPTESPTTGTNERVPQPTHPDKAIRVESIPPVAILKDRIDVAILVLTGILAVVGIAGTCLPCQPCIRKGTKRTQVFAVSAVDAEARRRSAGR
jgi:hypothetical protein